MLHHALEDLVQALPGLAANRRTTDTFRFATRRSADETIQQTRRDLDAIARSAVPAGSRSSCRTTPSRTSSSMTKPRVSRVIIACRSWTTSSTSSIIVWEEYRRRALHQGGHEVIRQRRGGAQELEGARERPHPEPAPHERSDRRGAGRRSRATGASHLFVLIRQNGGGVPCRSSSCWGFWASSTHGQHLPASRHLRPLNRTPRAAPRNHRPYRDHPHLRV